MPNIDTQGPDTDFTQADNDRERFQADCIDDIRNFLKSGKAWEFTYAAGPVEEISLKNMFCCASEFLDALEFEKLTNNTMLANNDNDKIKAVGELKDWFIQEIAIHIENEEWIAHD